MMPPGDVAAETQRYLQLKQRRFDRPVQCLQFPRCKFNGNVAINVEKAVHLPSPS